MLVIQPFSFPCKVARKQAGKSDLRSTPRCRASATRPRVRVPSTRRPRIIVMTIAAIPIGMLTKKIHRQPAHSVSTPPTKRADRDRRPGRRAPVCRRPFPRSRPWNAFARKCERDREHDNRRRRPAQRARRSGCLHSTAIPQANDAMVNSTRPSVKTAAATEEVGERAGREHRRGERERVRVDHPLELSEARIEVALHVGQGDVDDRDVEEKHEDRRAHGDQRPPLAVEALHSPSLPAAA